MADKAPRTAAEKLRLQAGLLFELADEFEQPSYSTTRVELLIGSVERVAADVRAVVRGPC